MVGNMKILLVEDEENLRRILEKRLKKQFTVDVCGDGRAALDFLEVYGYDIVLLDIMLPKVDGLSVLRDMRKRKLDTPVILLTAKNLVEDRVKGLDAGADDYLVKPFAYEELLARIRVALRRSASRSTNQIQVGELSLDIENHTVIRAGRTISLSNKEFLLLEYMMHHPGVTLTRYQLEQRVCDQSYEGGSNLVDVYIRYLRRKIDDGWDTKMIRTVRGVGYRLEGGKHEE